MRTLDLSKPVLATFRENLTSVVFMQNDAIVDPRLILSLLASGNAHVSYEPTYREKDDFLEPDILSAQTWTVTFTYS